MPDLWDRQPGEAAIWFDRFTAYRLVGPSRSLASTYAQAVKTAAGLTPPAVWYDQFDRWQWRLRALEWDKAERRRIDAERTDEQQRTRQQRVGVLRAVRGRAVEQLQNITPADPLWQPVVAALTATNRELRAEEDQ